MQSDVEESLLEALFGHGFNDHEVEQVETKAASQDASYVEAGPAPFVCVNCRYMIHGQNTCELVEGPYQGGQVDPDDSCRLWQARPLFAARLPLFDDGAND